MKRSELIIAFIVLNFLLAPSSFAGSARYIYDGLDRIRQVIYDDNGAGYAYDYDELGNLTSKTSLSFPVLSVFPVHYNTRVLVNSSRNPAYIYTLTNIGQANLIFGTATISGDNSTEFTIVTDNCSNRPIGPSADCEIVLSFNPKSEGLKTAVITVPSNSVNKPSYTDSLTDTAYIPTLTISKGGSGTGTVTINPGGLVCGSQCSGKFMPGTSVTLTAVPDTGFIFGGWDGTGCSSSTNTCTITLNDDMTFWLSFRPPSMSTTISVNPSLGGEAPLTADFLAIIDNLLPGLTWKWDFGDGTSSSQLRVTHIYSNPGDYHYWFRTYKADGSIEGVIGSVINVTPSDVRLLRVPPIYVPSFKDAYDAAVNGDKIQLTSWAYIRDLNLNQIKNITIDAGYNYNYTAKDSATRVYGSLTVSSGSVTIDDLVIQ